MQENEMLKLFQAIREIFPESFLQLLDKNNHMIQETLRSEYYPDEPVSYSGFKEIVSLKNAQGEAFYKLTFPVAPIYMLRLLIPAAKTEDVFISAKMAESIIQLFQANQPEKLKPPDRATWRFCWIIFFIRLPPRIILILHCWLLNWIWICHSSGQSAFYSFRPRMVCPPLPKRQQPRPFSRWSGTLSPLLEIRIFWGTLVPAKSSCAM